MLITKRDAEYFICALNTRANETSLDTRELELRIKLCEFIGDHWLEYLPYYKNDLAARKEFERAQARYDKTHKQIELKRALLRAA